eukprot:g905.t1
MSLLEELEELRNSLEHRQETPSFDKTENEDVGIVSEYTAAIDTAEKSVEKLTRAIEGTGSELSLVTKHVSEIEELQEQNKDLEIVELRRQMTIKDKNVETLRETLLSNKQSYETKIQRLQDRLNRAEEENRQLAGNLTKAIDSKLELEAKLKEERCLTKRNAKENSSREKELWTALENAQQEHAKMIEELKRETKEKERLETKVHELKKIKDREFDKDAEIKHLRQLLEDEREHFKKAKKWLKAEMKSREDMEHLLLSLKDLTHSDHTTPNILLSEPEVSTTENDSELEQIKRDFRNRRLHLTEEGKHLQKQLQSTKRKLSKALRKRSTEQLLLADGVLILKAQELSMEVGQMIKQFSCRRWLARLNGQAVDDEIEFKRLVSGANLLSEKCGLSLTTNINDWKSFIPSSNFLINVLKEHGGLINFVEKSEEELKIFMEKLMPVLDINGENATRSVYEEIRIASAAEMPGAHTVIRHAGLQYIWWTNLLTEEVAWEDFWKVFPDSLSTLKDSSDDLGDLSVIKDLLQSPAVRRQFKTAINYSRNSEYVLSIEIDNAFAPNRTIEESIAILLDPLEDNSTFHFQDSDHRLKKSVLSCTHRVIRDESGVPSEGTEITGRVKEINQICTLIETGRCTVMITGAAGIGKTAVATTVADELLKSRIVKKTHYINLCNIHEVSEAIFKITVSLKQPIYQSAMSSENRQRNWLKRHTGHLQTPTCWVLDGIDQLLILPDTRVELFGLLADILEFFPKLSLIMTCSEAPEAAEVSCIDHIVKLGPLSRSEAVQYAETLHNRALSKGEASNLVSACEGFPLGIKIGGNGILTGGCSASHFLSRLKQIEQKFSVPMRSGWNRCHDIIREGLMYLSTEDKQRLVLLTYCPDEFTIDHAAAVLDWHQRPTQIWSLLKRLTMRGFLRYLPSNGSYRFEESVFDLLSVCTEIRGSISDHEIYQEVPGMLELDENVQDSARAGLVMHYLKLLDRALVIFKSGYHLSTYRLLQQESNGFNQFTKYLTEHSVRQKLLSVGHKGKLMKLLKILCDFLLDVGKQYFTRSQVKSICTSIFHLCEINTTTQSFNESSYKLLISLANVLASIGERRDAESILNQIESSINVMSSCTEKDLKAKADLLLVRAKIQHLIGRYPDAERLYLQALHAQQGAYGPDDFTVSRTYSSLATVQQILYKFEDAEKSYKSSLKIRMKYSNKNMLEVPRVMHNWASLNQKLGKHADAETLYIKSLILREKYLGHTNIEVASTLVSLAAVKVSLQDFEEARNLYLRALSMLKDIIGEDHLVIAHTSTRLGVLLELRRSYEEAVQYFADALMINLRVLGDHQHESIIKSVTRIQRVAIKQGQKLNSASQLEKWKFYIEKILSPLNYTCPEASASVNLKPTGFHGLETNMDLYGTNYSISKCLIPGEMDASQQNQLQRRRNSASLSFQGFVQSTAGQYVRKQSTRESVWESESDREQHQMISESGESASTPSTPLLGRSTSALGTFFGDPPSPVFHGNENSSIRQQQEQMNAIRKVPSYSDLQSAEKIDFENTNSVPEVYSAVHDNSQFKNNQLVSLVMETTNSLPPRMLEDDQIQMNSYMTFSVEDDLLESTMALDPEQYDVIQSMIKNPLYRTEDGMNTLSQTEMPELLINTYASFEL